VIGRGLRFVAKPIEPTIGVGLEDPGIAGKMAARVLAVAVAEIEEHRGGWSRSGKRPVIADIRPYAAGQGLQYRRPLLSGGRQLKRLCRQPAKCLF
jgi:hypothetical protein